MAMKWCSNLEVAKKSCPVVFQGHPWNFKVTRDKYRRFWVELSISGLSLRFEFTDGFEMIYKALISIEVVPYCLSRSSIQFQGHRGLKIANFDPNWAFLDCNCSLNSPIGLKWCTKLDVVQKVPYCFSRSSIKFEGHMDRKIKDLNPILSKITRLVAAMKSLRFALFINLNIWKYMKLNLLQITSFSFFLFALWMTRKI